VEDAEKAAWLDAADVLVLPSAYESFGLVLAEAWSVGTPVVTSDIPVLAQLVADSGGGVTAAREPAALASALARLLADPARARELGAAGRAYWEERLTPEAAAARTMRVYAELLGNGVS
jgi:glycosyltransferase involved in cell wall biosynthesis